MVTCTLACGISTYLPWRGLPGRRCILSALKTMTPLRLPFPQTLTAIHCRDKMTSAVSAAMRCGAKSLRKVPATLFFISFHGYGRREIAELAQLPIAAIYNKLKTARSEVRVYLEEPGKLRIVNRDTPPNPTLSWNLLSSQDLFRELRQMILDARKTDCLPEEELLAHYRSAMPRPISCALLAHIVSCERCLSLIDRDSCRPTLKDREPLDVFGFSPENGGDVADPAAMSFEAMRSSVRRKWARIHEHRPRTLMIALNGQVIAYHDVRSEHNRLSARIERTEKAQFVEVFSEQDVRLALIEVSEPPPDGPPLSSQRIALSDARWLELNLTYDGLGLQSEVTYFDPALSAAVIEEDAEAALPFFATETQKPADELGLLQGLRAILARAAELLRAVVPASAMAWALVLVIAVSVGSLSHLPPCSITDGRCSDSQRLHPITERELAGTNGASSVAHGREFFRRRNAPPGGRGLVEGWRRQQIHSTAV